MTKKINIKLHKKIAEVSMDTIQKSATKNFAKMWMIGQCLVKMTYVANFGQSLLIVSVENDDFTLMINIENWKT